MNGRPIFNRYRGERRESCSNLQSPSRRRRRRRVDETCIIFNYTILSAYRYTYTL